MRKHWTEELFIDAADLYGLDLEMGIAKAREDVPGIVSIFSVFGVHQGALVLDVPCGIGRYSVELADKGYEVVGVDLSPPFIDRAKEIAEKRDVADKCDFSVGDMRRIGDVLKGPERFDVVLIIFTSLGYYDEATDREILKQLQGLTKPGGILILDMFNRDWMVRHFRPVDILQKGGGLVMVEERRLNLENSRMEAIWRYYLKDEGDLKHMKTIEIDNRLYSLHELKRLVEGCGWEYRACYGGFDMRSFSMDTNRTILVAQRA